MLKQWMQKMFSLDPDGPAYRMLWMCVCVMLLGIGLMAISIFGKIVLSIFGR